MNLCCYRYNNIASSSNTNNNDIKLGNNRIHSLWEINLGEHILEIKDIKIHKDNNKKNILCFGERTLFILNDSGKIITQTRWYYHPMTCAIYNSSLTSNDNNNIIVSTNQASLMVYNSNMKLLWAAKTHDESIPIAIKVAKFNDVDGFIVTLSDNGTVRINFMGTDPPIKGKQMNETKPIDFNSLAKEHEELVQVMQAAASNNLSELKDTLSIEAEVINEIIITDANIDKVAINENNQTLMAMVHIAVSYNGDSDLNDVTINLAIPEGIIVAHNSLHIPIISAHSENDPIVIPIEFYPMINVIPYSLEAQAVAVYTNIDNIPISTTCTFHLPLSLIAKVVIPNNNFEYSFILESSLKPPAMNELFFNMFNNDEIKNNSEINNYATNVITLSFIANNSLASILFSSQNARIKLQSNSFITLSFITQLISNRLKLYFKDHSNDFKLLYKADLPLKDFFINIEKHYNICKIINNLSNELNILSQQFRMIQKDY